MKFHGRYGSKVSSMIGGLWARRKKTMGHICTCVLRTFGQGTLMIRLGLPVEKQTRCHERTYHLYGPSNLKFLLILNALISETVVCILIVAML